MKIQTYSLVWTKFFFLLIIVLKDKLGYIKNF